MEIDPKENHLSKPKKKSSQVAKYSGLAFQLFFIIGAGSYLGYWLDGYFSNKIPYLLIIFMFSSTFIALYSLYKKLPKD